MAWMMDEYSRLREFDSPGFITGKPLVLGGSQGRETATARGVTICIEEAVKKKGIDLKGARIIVQGFGNAGSFLAKFMHDAGAKIIGISDVHGALYDQEGLDIDYLLDRRDSFGTVTTLFKDVITNKELLEKECDILVPAAISNQITSQNAPHIKASIVVEAANGPTTLEALKYLMIEAFSLYLIFWQVQVVSPFLTLNGCKIIKVIIGQRKRLQLNCGKSWSIPLKIFIKCRKGIKLICG